MCLHPTPICIYIAHATQHELRQRQARGFGLCGGRGGNHLLNQVTPTCFLPWSSGLGPPEAPWAIYSAEPSKAWQMYCRIVPLLTPEF